MALHESSVSIACREVVRFVKSRFDADEGANVVDVLVGPPSSATPPSSKHRLNLFFHRFDTAGFDPDGTSGDPWWIRIQCLVTAFAVAEDKLSEGENDLRLLGAVARYFHETPVMQAVTASGEQFRTQVVFQPLSLEDINHLWGTQRELAYRPSIAYEVALAPIVPARRDLPAPWVGALSITAGSTGAPPEAANPARPPEVRLTEVDANDPDWAPALCLVEDAPRRASSAISLQVGSPALASFQARALIAGAPGAQVTLQWDIWERASGWTPGAASGPASIQHGVIDPANLPAPATLPLAALPFTTRPGQLALSAVRTYRRAPSDPVRTARSNPVLITLYQGAA